MIEIKTPRGIISESKSGKAKLIWNDDFAKRRNEQFDAVQKMVDSEVLRQSDPYVPMRTGMLKKQIFVGYITFIGFWSHPLINNKTVCLKELFKKKE